MHLYEWPSLSLSYLFGLLFKSKLLWVLLPRPWLQQHRESFNSWALGGATYMLNVVSGCCLSAGLCQWASHLSSLHEDLPLLLLLPLLLHLVQLLQELELGPNITNLLIPTILLEEGSKDGWMGKWAWWKDKKKQKGLRICHGFTWFNSNMPLSRQCNLLGNITQGVASVSLLHRNL